MELNPWNLWKQTYDVIEKNYSEPLHQNMHEEAFGAWMGACQQWYLFFTDMHNKALEQYYQYSRLASQENVAQVSSLVIQVEEKVEALDDKINDEILLKLEEIQQLITQLKNS